MSSDTIPPIQAAPSQTRRVLCAEDHPQMSELMETVLTRAGHQVVCAIDGQQALQRFAESKFDVVVTDHQMPNVDGLQLVTTLRQQGFSGKIIVHTSRLTPEEEAEYRTLAIHVVLMKPGGIRELPAAVA